MRRRARLRGVKMSADHWAISNLIARYAELLNLGQVDDVAELFRYGRITGTGMGDVVGSEAVGAMYAKASCSPTKSTHSSSRAICRSRSMVMRPRARPTSPPCIRATEQSCR